MAIKSVKHPCSEQQHNALMQEIRIVSHVHNNRHHDRQHINVIGFVGAVTRHLKRGWRAYILRYLETGKLYMVMEYCDIGSLEEYLLEQSNASTPMENSVSDLSASTCLIENNTIQHDIELLSFAYQIANGMKFLNSKTVRVVFNVSFTVSILGNPPRFSSQKYFIDEPQR